MSTDQAVLLLILFALLVLLVWGRWRYDIVALGALFTASIFGLVPQTELFAGFGNPATITVVMVLIVSFGLTKSGAVEFIADAIEPISSTPYLHIAVLTFLAAFLSMFMNNVGALALLMPIAIKSTTMAGRSPATVLMPLSFGSILGGLVTLIGTPPNILIANYRQQMTGEAFTMFDFAPVGGGIAICGIFFMLLIGWKLVRVRKQTTGLDLFDVEKYLFELKVTEESVFANKKAGELRDALAEQKLSVLSMVHRREKLPMVYRRQMILPNDLLMLQGSHDDIAQFASANGLLMVSAENAQKEVLHSEDSKVAEVVVTPNSPIVGRTVSQIRFNRKYSVNLLAASRSGTPHKERLRDFKFEIGDVLLLHGGGRRNRGGDNKVELLSAGESSSGSGQEQEGSACHAHVYYRHCRSGKWSGNYSAGLGFCNGGHGVAKYSTGQGVLRWRRLGCSRSAGCDDSAWGCIGNDRDNDTVS